MKHQTEANDPAFPQHPERHFNHGLTKREYFAAMAMQGILADSEVKDIKQAVDASIEAADYLIDTLNKKVESNAS